VNEILDVVVRVPGVSGAALCSPQGECVLSQLVPPFEPVLVKKIVSEVRGVFQTMRYLDDSEPQFLVVHFDDVVVAVRQIEELTLVAFATSTTSVAMLGVAFNVVNLKIRDHGIANFDLAAGTGLTPGRGSQSSRPGGGIPTPVPSGSAGLSMFDSVQPAAPDFIGDEFVQRLVKALARQLGPAARFVFKQQVKHVGLTVGEITPHNLLTVVEALVQRVTDVTKREAFLSDVRALLRR